VLSSAAAASAITIACATTGVDVHAFIRDEVIDAVNDEVKD